MSEKLLRGEGRPEFVMEDYEDAIYHDHTTDTDPEFYAFTRQIMVFNRTMRWLDKDNDGCIVCYSETSDGDLYLTGENQVSRWFSDPDNTISENGDFTVFTKKTLKRRADCAVLPVFQFHKGQHPVVELTVSEATADWQFCIFIKGRSGKPVMCSGWKTGSCTVSFDIAAELEKRGFGTLQFAELHFAAGTWNKDKEASSSLTFRLRMPGHAAVVSCLPVIRTFESIKKEGLPVAALVLDKNGRRLTNDSISVQASYSGIKIPLKESSGIWRATIPVPEMGDYRIELDAEGSACVKDIINLKGFVNARVTDGRFISYDSEHNLPVCNGKITGPLSGSYHGFSFVKNAGCEGERLINGQQDWDSMDHTAQPGERFHYWEAMTERELDEKFTYLENCGWNILHLSQHFGVWKRLDAGGRISPHGAEQLALYIRAAAKHGLAVLQALTHYPYGVSMGVNHFVTPPFSRYFEEGFKNEHWTDIDNHFTEMFHEFLTHFVTIFKDETGLFGMTTSGEGDYVALKDRVNDTYDYVKSVDKNHLFIAEPILMLKKLPREYYEGWKQPLFGSRVYWAGEEAYPEYDLGLEFKMMQLGPVFMGEGSWPCPPLYASLTEEESAKGPNWCGTSRYRIRVRDSIYLGMVHRLPLLLTWDEQISEDERIVFNQVRKLVNWNQKFIKPDVGIVVDSSNLEGDARKCLIEYEKAFMAMPLAHRYIEAGSDVDIVFDARKPFIAPGFESEGGSLPDSLKNKMPLKISEGYSSEYMWSEDRKTLVAYVFNTSNHIEIDYLSLAGRFHRIPKPVRLNVALQNLPDTGLSYCVYDLNEKLPIIQGTIKNELTLDLGNTYKDYLLIVIP